MPRIITTVLILFVSFGSQAKDCFGLVVARDGSHPFWNEVIHGAKKASDELGYELRFRGSVNEERQKLIIEHMMDMHQCVGMVIAPAGPIINDVVNELAQKKIPVTYIDRDTGGVRSAIVKSDNYYGGLLAAQVMAKKLHDSKSKNIALLRMKKEVASTTAREVGFLEEAKRLGLNIVIDKHLGITKGEGRKPATAVFTNHQDLDGVFTPTGATTEITIRVLEQLKYPKKPVMIGFDGSDYLDQKISDGTLDGYIKQDPYNIGYYGVYTTYNILKGKEYMPNLDIPVLYISKSDLE